MAVIALALHAAGVMDSLQLAGFVVPFLGGLLYFTWYYPVIYKLGKSFFLVLFVAMLLGIAFAVQGFVFTGVMNRIATFVAGIPFGLMLLVPVPVIFLAAWLMYVVANKMYRKPLSEWYVLQAFKQASR